MGKLITRDSSGIQRRGMSLYVVAVKMVDDDDAVSTSKLIK